MTRSVPYDNETPEWAKEWRNRPAVEPKPVGKSFTRASIALQERQLAARKLVKLVLQEEIAQQLAFEGATFSKEDRDEIIARCRKRTGSKPGQDVDTLARSVLFAMEQGDRSRAVHLSSGFSEGVANAGNQLGSSPLWEPPTREETGDPDPGELADEIINSR